MEIQTAGAKTALLGKRQLCRASGETGKAKWENASWLQQKTNILMPLLSARLWPRRNMGRGPFPRVHLRCSYCNWTWSCGLPGLRTLLVMAGCHFVWLSTGCLCFSASNSRQNEMKCGCLTWGRLRSTAAICRHVTGERWQQKNRWVFGVWLQKENLRGHTRDPLPRRRWKRIIPNWTGRGAAPWRVFAPNTSAAGILPSPQETCKITLYLTARSSAWLDTKQQSTGYTFCLRENES